MRVKIIIITLQVYKIALPKSIPNVFSVEDFT